MLVHNQAMDHMYTQRVRLNGVEWTQTHFDHATLMAGGTLEFFMVR